MAVSKIFRNRPKLFGRLGTRADIDPRIAEAKAAGAKVVEDKDAGTIKATYDGKILFRAMQKDARVWIVMYNKEFYPETQLPK